MVKRIGRRFVSLLLTFVTILMMLPAMTLPALAAGGDVPGGLVDSNIGLRYSGDTNDSWSAQGTTISGSITGLTKTGVCTKSQTSTLTISNNSGKKAILSFDYKIQLNEGSITIAGKTIEQNGNHSQTLDKDAAIEVQITSGEGKNKTTTIEMTNVNLETERGLTVTFQPAENGSYTVDNETITKDRNYNKSSTTPYRVRATPNEGYQFLGWYDVTNGSYLQGGANSDIYVSSDNSTVKAIFKAKGTTFQEGTSDLKWDDLNDAIISTRNNGSGQITLLKSCTISGEYTIPSGVTLLIPCDKDHTVFTEMPGTIGMKPAEKKQEVYTKLTMESGTKLVVNGAISVAAKVSTANSSYTALPAGEFGQIEMQEGASIVLESSSNLYCWGFITGKGDVIAKSGATVYEEFQIADYRGGTVTNNLNTKKLTFPFSQYYVQNIEARLEIQYGAVEKAVCRMHAADGFPADITLPFIAKDGGGLFNLTGENSKFVKWYDPKTERVSYEVYDDAKLSSISFTLKIILPVTVDSANFNLPIMQNTTINVKSGTTTIDQSLCLIPGSQVIIDEGATVKIASGKSLFVYDRSDWVYKEWDKETINVNGQQIPRYAYSGFTHPGTDFRPEYYTPSRSSDNSKCWTPHFTTADMKDVKFDINGTLNVAGKLYTTAGGADITSSLGSGKVVLSAAAPTGDAKTYQYMQNRKTDYDPSTKEYKTKAPEYKEINATPARLHNADDSYTATAGSKAGDTFTYCTGSECVGKWVPNLKVAAIINSDGTQGNTYTTLKEAVTNYQPDSSTPPKNYIQMLHSTTESITTDKDLYLDLNGCTVTGDFTMNGKILHGMDSSSKEYVAPSGKIVGAVSGYARTCQSPTVMDGNIETYDRYVAILGNEGTTQTLSFHHFNISVSGYRFELTSGDTPKCALFFIGKFRGDDAAKKHLKSLGFTLKGDNDAAPKEGSCEMPKALTDKFVEEDGDAYLFEFYLMRSFGKDASPASFTEGISATAKAMFQNESDLGEQVSKERSLSFKEAWEKADNLTPAQREIINKILREHGIN